MCTFSQGQGLLMGFLGCPFRRVQHQCNLACQWSLATYRRFIITKPPWHAVKPYGGCSCIWGVLFALLTLPGLAELVRRLVPGDVLADLGRRQLGGWDVLVLIHVSSSFSPAGEHSPCG